MDTMEYTALLATGIGGVLAYSYQQVAATLADRREAQLKRVEAQLAQVYGPLLALTNCNMQIFELFVTSSTPYVYPKQMKEVMKLVENDEKVRAEFVLWMTTALLPNHRAACEIIETKAHLFESDVMADFLIQYVSMVRAYDILEAKWKYGDFSNLFSPLRYPIDLNHHVEETFSQLRRKQHELLTQPVDPLHYYFYAYTKKRQPLYHLHHIAQPGENSTISKQSSVRNPVSSYVKVGPANFHVARAKIECTSKEEGPVTSDNALNAESSSSLEIDDDPD